jgi:hypothetical protein
VTLTIGIIEIILFVAIGALVSSLVSLLAFSYALKTHKREIINLQRRVHYLEGGMLHHGLLPLPWEMEDLNETKAFKQEGNVVYLQKEE